MIYLTLIILIVAIMYMQKLIHNGTIPPADNAKGLPTRLVAILLFVLCVVLVTLLKVGGSINGSNALTSVILAIALAASAIMTVKRRQQQWKAGTLPKRDMKSSLMFLGFALLVATILGVLYPFIHK